MPDLQDAISLLEKGNAREASVLLEAMVQDMPGYATARVLLARSYEGLGEWDGALASWREALQIVPNSPVIRRGLERAARKASSLAPADELPSVSVSEPTDVAPETDDGPEAEQEPTGTTSTAAEELEEEIPDVAPAEDQEPPEADAGPTEVARETEDIAPEDELAQDDESIVPDARSVTPDMDVLGDDAILDDGDETTADTREETRADESEETAFDGAQEAVAEEDAEPAELMPEAASPDALAETEIDAAEPISAEAGEVKERPSRSDDEDLDRLIAELESARIVPRPDFDSLPEPELEDDIEDVVSVTLARIYASQGQYEEAARVYELLAGQQPDNEAEFTAKAAEMRSKASEE